MYKMLYKVCINTRKKERQRLLHDLIHNGPIFSISKIKKEYGINYYSIMRNKDLFIFTKKTNKYIGRDRIEVKLKSGYVELIKQFSQNENCKKILEIYF